MEVIKSAWRNIMIKTLLTAGTLLISNVLFADFLPTAFSSKFEQEYVSTLKGKVKKGLGTIDYKYPGQIRFETTTPSPVIFTSNGTKAWYYRAPFIEGEQGEVTEMAAKDGATVYIKFFDALKKGLTSNDFYEVKDTTLTFKPKAKADLGIINAKLSFKNKSQKFENLDTIELTTTDGKNTKIKFVDLNTSPAFGNDRFNFVTPPNTKKVN